jgi:hypothetical protein
MGEYRVERSSGSLWYVKKDKQPTDLAIASGITVISFHRQQERKVSVSTKQPPAVAGGLAVIRANTIFWVRFM